MSIELKRALLSAVYEAYEEAARHFPRACRRECRACCTHNVIATTLEIDLMIDRMERSGLLALQEKILQGTTGKRLRPALSINTLA